VILSGREAIPILPLSAVDYTKLPPPFRRRRGWRNRLRSKRRVEKVANRPHAIRAKKLFQFLNEIRARALRMHLSRVLEIAKSSPTRDTYEQKIMERFGGERQLELPMPMPAQQEAAN
jgi:hypothetical protein